MNPERSAWQKEYEDKAMLPELTGELVADVVIVGGGMAGTLTAYLLSKAGQKVVVLEREFLTRSVTAKTTGFLVADIDTSLVDLESVFWAKMARMIMESGLTAIESIEKIVQEEDIACDFMRCDEYMLALTERWFDDLRREAELGKKYGFGFSIGKGTLPVRNSGFAVFRNQAKFDPLRFLFGVREKARGYGALFFEESEACSMTGNRKVTVSTGKGSVTADAAIMTTHRPMENPRSLFAKKGMYLSYVLEFEVPQGAIPEALYIDSMNPYHYFRVDAGAKTDRLILGGEDHRMELPMESQKSYDALREYAVDRFGQIPMKEVGRWKGPIYESVDGLAFIGRYSRKFKNRYIATAFSGNGLTYSMISAMIFHDMILGKKNPYAPIYDPLRPIRLKALLLKTRDYLEIFAYGWLRNIWRRGHKKNN